MALTAPSRAIVFGAFTLLAMATLPARADSVPYLDVEKTCQSAKTADSGTSEKATYDGCIRSERDAKKEAEKNWGNYTAPAKHQCEAQFQAGGYPSYVEMITCLELASGTVPTQSGDSNEAVGGPDRKAARAERSGASGLTKEPSASQRTDPIKVLENN